MYQDPHEKDVRFWTHYGDMTDATNLIRIVQETQPDEIYNLAAQSHVAVSFETPEYTANADALARELLGPATHFSFDHGINKPVRPDSQTPWHQDQAFHRFGSEHLGDAQVVARIPLCSPGRLCGKVFDMPAM